MRFGNLLLLVLVSGFILFFNLGVAPLFDPDEPVYAETAKEMIQFNDYVSPRIYGEYWYDKPPMYYWLVAGSFKVFGISDFASRFPSALLGLLTVLYMYYAGRRLLGERAGFLGAMALATSIEFFYLGKAAVTDITLNLFLAVALLSFLQRQYYIMYIAAGLALVTKGPVGFLFPGAIIFLHLLFTRDFSRMKEMCIPTGTILFAAVGLPWYVAMYQIHGAPFIETFIGFHNITRFTSPEHPEGVLWYFFIPILILGFLPWTGLMAQSIWKALTDGRDKQRTLGFLVLWAAFIFVFFSISRTKLVSYILPMFPPLAMLAGWYLDRIWDNRRESRVFSWPILSTLLMGLFGAGAILATYDKIPALLPGAIAIAGAFGLAILALWIFTVRREVGRAFWVQIAAMVAFSVILMTLLIPPAAPAFHCRDLAKSFNTVYDGKSTVYVIKFLRPGFAFYSGVYGKELLGDNLRKAMEEKGKTYFVVRKSDIRDLSESEQKKFEIIATQDEKVILLKP